MKKTKTGSIRFHIIYLLVIFVLAAGNLWAQNNQQDFSAEKKAINAVIDKYNKTEDVGDLNAQALLMSPDRVWIGYAGIGRIQDQVFNMESQKAYYESIVGTIPGIKFFTEARDRIIKFAGEGNVAVVSFYWFRFMVFPKNTTAEKMKLFPAPDPSVITLVMEKQGDNWIIIHGHASLVHPAH